MILLQMKHPACGWTNHYGLLIVTILTSHNIHLLLSDNVVYHFSLEEEVTMVLVKMTDMVRNI